MSADTVTAASAAIIAILALIVSVVQTRAIWDHNRQSVRPILRLVRQREYDGSMAGLKLSNKGLGPAIITKSEFYIDGRPMGQWEREWVNPVLEELPAMPKLLTLPNETVLEAGFTRYLLCLSEYKHEQHRAFWQLIYNRLHLIIHYESIYGGEGYRVIMGPRPSYLD